MSDTSTAAKTPPSSSTSPSTPPAFKVGFIGTGGIALTHMKFLKAIAGVELWAGADVWEPSLERARKEYGLSRSFHDHKTMLKECPDLDAVSVCTPNGLHAENTIAALEAGKHVIVEKPMAMNAAEGKRMVDAAKASGKQLVVGFQWRFDQKTQYIRQQIQAGMFGKILYVRVQALRRRGIPNWGVFGRKELQGGGPMIDIGVHVLEMAHAMIGTPSPVSATGNCFTYMGNQPSSVKSMWPNWDHKTYNVEDLAVGMVRFDTGAMLTVEASFVAHIEKDVWNVTIMGEKAGANWETSGIFTDINNYMFNMSPGYLPSTDHWTEKMNHFVQVCKGQRVNESTGEHGLMVQKMLDGIYASAAAGREVAIE